MNEAMKHLTEEQLILHYYGDAENAAAVETHLEACSACRAEYASLQRTLNTVDGLPVPERGAEYGAQVWARVSAELGLGAKRSWRDRLRAAWSGGIPRWATAGGVTMLLALAFLAGRWTVRPTLPQGPASQVANARAGHERILLDALGEHLDRSQMTLVSLANSGAGETPMERDQAEDLLKENRLYRQAAVRSGDENAAVVLDELERVLTEVANAPDSDLDGLRQRMARQDLLFKIRVLRSQVMQKEKAVRPDPMVRN